MSALAEAAASYLQLRRALGFKLARHERDLASLVSYLGERGLQSLTAEAAIAWACLPADRGPDMWSRRLSLARGFAGYLRSVDPATELVPARVWPPRPRREPFVCSPAEVDSLVDAAGRFGAPFRAASYQTLIGLVAVTGMRVGEARRLDDEDVDVDRGLLTIRNSKFTKSRELPLHASTRSALAAYVELRDERFPRRSGANLFASSTGTRVGMPRLGEHWHATVDHAGVARGDGRRPRLHDLRHSFAVNTMRAWHEAGLDVEVRLPLLSTYLGHVNPAATYWYLTATPDLLAAAARRLDASVGATS